MALSKLSLVHIGAIAFLLAALGAPPRAVTAATQGPHATVADMARADPRMAWLASACEAALHQLQINQCGSEEKHPCGGRDFSNGAVSEYLVHGGKEAMRWLAKVQPGPSFVGQGFCALAHEAPFMASQNASSRAWIIGSINKALPELAQYNGTDVR